MKIYVIEDDDKLREELIMLLKNNDYNVEFTTDYQNAVSNILTSDADLVLLDINLPIADGYLICRMLRKKSQVPIIVVTSRNSDSDELLSLNLGADDFITKPYSPAILLAHIQSVVKRLNKAEILTYKELRHDFLSSEITYRNETVSLTNNENKIMRLLMKKRETIVTRDEIMNELWQTNEFIDDNTLTVNMNRLRHKLEDIGLNGFLETMRGQGYKI